MAEQLDRGFGVSLGDALRRVLLSSLQGAAVQSVHMDGVLHEFSSIPGVREDVTDIVLNIKDIAVKMQGDGPKRMVVKKQGPSTITAGDIQVVNWAGFKSAVTYSFDDNNSTQIQHYAEMQALGVPFTFFLWTGKSEATNAVWATAKTDGHELANHTFSHGDLARLDDAQVLGEMERAEAAIVAATGHGTKPFWRAPYGSRNPRLLQLIANAGWPYHIFWTADALDWMPIPPAQVRANMNRGAVNGGIVLAHCGSPQTAEVIGEHTTRNARELFGLRAV